MTNFDYRKYNTYVTYIYITKTPRLETLFDL